MPDVIIPRAEDLEWTCETCGQKVKVQLEARWFEENERFCPGCYQPLPKENKDGDS